MGYHDVFIVGRLETFVGQNFGIECDFTYFVTYWLDVTNASEIRRKYFIYLYRY